MPRFYENWLQGYTHYTRASESPLSFHFWTAVSTVAGALRRKVWIEQKYFQWTPNFYIVLVGPPGVAAKSTSIRSGMKFLEKLKDVKFGPQSMTWQALTLSLQDAIETLRWYDKYGKEHQQPISCLTIPVGELGTFLKTDDSSMMDVLVALWDGQLEVWGHHTKSSGNIEVRNPWLNIIACTTPAWLREHFPEHMIGGGLTSRIIFVYGEAKRHLVAYPSEAIDDDSFQEEHRKLLCDLLEISTISGEYVLDAKTIAWGTKWYEKHWAERPQHMASQRFEGYMARKQTHIHKLAMILAASKRNQLIILPEDLEEAALLIDSIEPDMQKVFENVGVADEAKRVREMVSYVRNYKFLTTPQLWKLCMSIMSFRDFEMALRAAIEAGVITGTTYNGMKGVKVP